MSQYIIELLTYGQIIRPVLAQTVPLVIIDTICIVLIIEQIEGHCSLRPPHLQLGRLPPDLHLGWLTVGPLPSPASNMLQG